MVCFVPSVCLSIRKSCQRHDCSELGIVRNWEEHCITTAMKNKWGKLPKRRQKHGHWNKSFNFLFIFAYLFTGFIYFILFFFFNFHFFLLAVKFHLKFSFYFPCTFLFSRLINFAIRFIELLPNFIMV